MSLMAKNTVFFIGIFLICKLTSAEPWYRGQVTPNFDHAYFLFDIDDLYPYGKPSDGTGLNQLLSKACPKSIEEWSQARRTLSRSISGNLDRLNDGKGVSTFLKNCGLGPFSCLKDFAEMAALEKEFQAWQNAPQLKVDTMLRVPKELKDPKTWELLQKGPVSLNRLQSHLLGLSPDSAKWQVFATRGSFGGIGKVLGNYEGPTPNDIKGRMIVAIPGDPPSIYAFPFLEDEGPRDDPDKPRPFFSNFSLISIDMANPKEVVPFASDFSIPSLPGEALSAKTVVNGKTCTSCHMKGGISFVSYENSLWTHRDSQSKAHALMQSHVMAPFLRGDIYGPQLGPIIERSDKQIKSCINDIKDIRHPDTKESFFPEILERIAEAEADTRKMAFSLHKIKMAMNCSECHKPNSKAGVINTWTLGRHASLNSRARWNIMKGHVLSGDMPRNSKFPLDPWERRVVVHCLTKELYGENGLWKQFGSNKSCEGPNPPDPYAPLSEP